MRSNPAVDAEWSGVWSAAVDALHLGTKEEILYRQITIRLSQSTEIELYLVMSENPRH